MLPYGGKYIFAKYDFLVDLGWNVIWTHLSTSDKLNKETMIQPHAKTKYFVLKDSDQKLEERKLGANQKLAWMTLQ